MLQLTDEGAKITLTGQSTPTGDGLFWFGFALLVGAVAVAIAMSILPVQWAIGALGLLVLASFIFNVKRQQQKKLSMGQISSGVIQVRHGELIHEGFGKRQHIVIEQGDDIQTTESQLNIVSADKQMKCQIIGFESAQEVAVMAAILQGKAINKRHAKIKMQSSGDD